jgi:hypothetical protein
MAGWQPVGAADCSIDGPGSKRRPPAGSPLPGRCLAGQFASFWPVVCPGPECVRLGTETADSDGRALRREGAADPAARSVAGTGKRPITSSRRRPLSSPSAPARRDLGTRDAGQDAGLRQLPLVALRLRPLVRCAVPISQSNISTASEVGRRRLPSDREQGGGTTLGREAQRVAIMGDAGHAGDGAVAVGVDRATPLVGELGRGQALRTLDDARRSISFDPSGTRAGSLSRPPLMLPAGCAPVQACYVMLPCLRRPTC